MQEKIIEMLRQSNWIESEYSDRALKDAIKAWEWIVKQKGDLKVSQVLRVHYLLGKNIDPDIAGKFRDCDVWIGGHCKSFISERLLRCQMVEFCKDFNVIAHKKGQNNLEEKTKENHIMFEYSHMFKDINGRTGRLLMNLLRVRVGLDVLIISGWSQGDRDFHPEQSSYYNWF